MPSDCQNLGGGGTGISIPLRLKVVGGGQLPPGSRAHVPNDMAPSPSESVPYGRVEDVPSGL